MRRLEALSRNSRGRETMVAGIQRLIAEINESLPPMRPIVNLPPPIKVDIEVKHSPLIRRIYMYILTGNTAQVLTKPSENLNDFADLRFIDNDVNETNCAIVIEFLIHMTVKALTWSFSPKLMVLVKLIFSNKDVVYHETLKAFSKICDTPSQLFLFVELSQGYAYREGLKRHPELTRDEVISKRLNKLKTVEKQVAKKVVLNDHGGAQGSADFKSKHKSNTKLRLHARETKCIKSFYEDDTKSVDLLLYFLLNTKSTRRRHLNHAKLICLSHPKFVDKKRRDLVNLIVFYILHGKQRFDKKVGEYIKKKPIIDGLENTVINVISMFDDIKQLRCHKDKRDVQKLMIHWKGFGKRNIRFDEGKTEKMIREYARYVESSSEYVNLENFAYCLTIQQIPDSCLYLPEVFNRSNILVGL